jgi:hypothetical protein
MKKLSLLLLFAVTQVTFAQKMIVDVKPATATVYVESAPVKNPVSINVKAAQMGLLAVNKGYATQGYTFADLALNNTTAFSINLQKITPLEAGYTSRVLEFTKITDATGKVEKPDMPGMYGITIKGTQLNTPLFTTAIAQSFTTYGYKMDGGNDMFKDKNKGDVELAIGAQLMYFSKDTRGSGYQVSIVVEWSVYSYTEKKIVMKMSTGGYSDTGQTQFNPELSLAFKDAVQGLLISPEFQKLAKK